MKSPSLPLFLSYSHTFTETVLIFSSSFIITCRLRIIISQRPWILHCRIFALQCQIQAVPSRISSLFVFDTTCRLRIIISQRPWILHCRIFALQRQIQAVLSRISSLFVSPLAGYIQPLCNFLTIHGISFAALRNVLTTLNNTELVVLLAGAVVDRTVR